MKLKLAAVTAFLAVSFVGAALAIRIYDRPRICKDNFDRIRCGMTKKKVEAILGGPPGDYSTGPVLRFAGIKLPYNGFGWGCRTCTDETWTGDGGTITVRFLEDGTVARQPLGTGAMARFEETFIVRPSFLDRVREWIGL